MVQYLPSLRESYGASTSKPSFFQRRRNQVASFKVVNYTQYQVLPFDLIRLILDYLPPYRLLLEKRKYLIEVSNKTNQVNPDPDYLVDVTHQYKVNYHLLIKELYGYFAKDYLRTYFLLFVNMDVINIDIPHDLFIRWLTPWKRLKYYKFVNDNPELIIDKVIRYRNGFVEADNRCLHSLDLSYWQLDPDKSIMTPRLSLDANYERQGQQQIRSLNLSHSCLPQILFIKILHQCQQVAFLDMSDIEPLDASDNSPFANQLCELKKLKTLSITVNHLGLQLARHLMSLERLFKLYISYHTSDVGCLSLIIQNSSLRDLSFICTGGVVNSLDTREFDSLICPGFTNRRLERLDITGTVLQIEHTAVMLKLFPNLSKLYMYFCGLNNAHIEALLYESSQRDLSEIDKYNGPYKTSRIQYLGIANNFITITGLKLICHLLKDHLIQICINESDFLPMSDLEPLINEDESCVGIDFVLL